MAIFAERAGISLQILERSKSLPAMPTCAELGFDGFDIATMIGLQAPAALPPRFRSG
jgi:tripartite-type tricarboxylate transporter receptor subunit TctC